MSARAVAVDKIELGEKFFNEIISHPVPLNMNTLTALKRSSLGLDLYLSLPDLHASGSAAAHLEAGVPSVPEPGSRFAARSGSPGSGGVPDTFGAHLRPRPGQGRRTVDDFRKDCLRELKKIKLAWSGLNYSTAPGVLILLPSKPAIPPAPEPLRLAE